MLKFRLLAALVASPFLLVSVPGIAQEAAAPAAAPMDTAAPAPNDLLNAALWIQRSVEFKANAVAVYALGRIRLDAALADKSASALDQTGAADLPPAVILDLDETVMDNSAYESGLVTSNADYSSKTWAVWVAAKEAKAIPGSLDYIKYADSKDVKIFYVTNRKADEEEATRANLEALGYPMGGNVDTFLTRDEKPDWKSDKTTRRAFIAKDYRVVAMFGDNFNDFTDMAIGTTEEREAAFETMQAHFSTDWFMLANPTYGSWESTTFGDDFKLSNEEKRALKVKALQPWTPTKP